MADARDVNDPADPTCYCGHLASEHFDSGCGDPRGGCKCRRSPADVRKLAVERGGAQAEWLADQDPATIAGAIGALRAFVDNAPDGSIIRPGLEEFTAALRTAARDGLATIAAHHDIESLTIGTFEVRGVTLGGSKVSATVVLKLGESVFTMLTTDEIGQQFGALIGQRIAVRATLAIA